MPAIKSVTETETFEGKVVKEASLEAEYRAVLKKLGVEKPRELIDLYAKMVDKFQQAEKGRLTEKKHKENLEFDFGELKDESVL